MSTLSGEGEVPHRPVAPKEIHTTTQALEQAIQRPAAIEQPAKTVPEEQCLAALHDQIRQDYGKLGDMIAKHLEETIKERKEQALQQEKSDGPGFVRRHIEGIAASLAATTIATAGIHIYDTVHEAKVPAETVKVQKSVERTIGSSDLSLWRATSQGPEFSGTVHVKVLEDQDGARKVEVDAPQPLKFTFQPDTSVTGENEMTIHQKQNDPGHFYTEFDMAPDYSKGMRISVQPSQAEEALGPSGENVGRDIPPDVPVIIYDGQGLK